MTQSAQQTDFLAVALAARSRGFSWVTPVQDKRGVLHGWHKRNLTSTESELRAIAADFPHHNVGIVSRRGVGNLFFLDIDKPGVLERMERETGRALPDTYITHTRPKSKPWKMHVYFTQTAYSVSQFTKQVYAGEYDLKGMGGPGYVVAENCVREGEQIEGNGKSVLPIPDWLVNWLRSDSQKLLALQREEQKTMAATKRHELKEAYAAIAEHELEMKAKQNLLVLKGYRTKFLKSRAGSLASLGVNREDRETVLRSLCREYCEDGRAYVESPEGQKAIHAIAFDRGLQVGFAPPAYTRRTHPVNQDTAAKPILISASANYVKNQQLLDICCEFPNAIEAAEAYRLLQLDSRIKADNHKLQRIMHRAGFVAKGRTWIRQVRGE